MIDHSVSKASISQSVSPVSPESGCLFSNSKLKKVLSFQRDVTTNCIIIIVVVRSLSTHDDDGFDARGRTRNPLDGDGDDGDDDTRG